MQAACQSIVGPQVDCKRVQVAAIWQWGVMQGVSDDGGGHAVLRGAVPEGGGSARPVPPNQLSAESGRHHLPARQCGVLPRQACLSDNEPLFQ